MLEQDFCLQIFRAFAIVASFGALHFITSLLGHCTRHAACSYPITILGLEYIAKLCTSSRSNCCWRKILKAWQAHQIWLLSVSAHRCMGQVSWGHAPYQKCKVKWKEMRQALLQAFIRSPVSLLMVSLLLTRIALRQISRLMNRSLPLVSAVLTPCLLSVQTSAAAENHFPGQTQCCHLHTMIARAIAQSSANKPGTIFCTSTSSRGDGVLPRVPSSHKENSRAALFCYFCIH